MTPATPRPSRREPVPSPRPGGEPPSDPLSLEVDGLRYVLDRPPSRAGKKIVVSVRLTHGDGSPLVDRSDLYAFRSRRSFATLVSDTFGRPVDVILGHLSLLLDHAERADLTPTKPQPILLSPSRRDAAETLLRSPDLLDRAALALSALGCVGEDAAKRLAFLAATSRVLSHPVSALLSAPPGTGKSTLLDSVTSLIPHEDLVSVVRITRAALFHVGEGSLQHRLLVVDELDGAAEADHAIRVLQSRGELSLTETVLGRAVTRSVRGPVAVLSATVAPEALDLQNRSRFLVVELDPGPEQTARVHHARARSWAGDAPPPPDLELWQDAQRLLSLAAPLVVRIPFADKISFPDRVSTDRRVSEQIFGLVAASAALHGLRRERDRTGQLIAQVEDSALVHGLLARSVEATVAGLSSRAAKVYRWLLEQPDAVDRREIAEALKVSYNTAKSAVVELEGQELVRQAQAGPPARYRPLGRSILGEGVSLTPPEALLS